MICCFIKYENVKFYDIFLSKTNTHNMSLIKCFIMYAI